MRRISEGNSESYKRAGPLDGQKWQGNREIISEGPSSLDGHEIVKHCHRVRFFLALKDWNWCYVAFFQLYKRKTAVAVVLKNVGTHLGINTAESDRDVRTRTMTRQSLLDS